MADEQPGPTVAPLPQPPGGFGWALTVDVEEWYHSCMVPDYVDPSRRPPLVEELDRLLPDLLQLLAERDRRATFFVLGELALRRPAAIREIAAAGHEVASHGYLHLRAAWQTPTAFATDALRSKRLLEDTIGQAVLGFRAPEWSLRRLGNPRLRALADLGYLYDSSLTPSWGSGDRANPRIPARLEWGDGVWLREFPPLVFAGALRLPAGGWTGRLMPAGVLAGAARHQHGAGGLPVAVVHPWEIAASPTPGELTGLARFLHEAGRRGFREKFLELLAAHPWTSLRAAAAALEPRRE